MTSLDEDFPKPEPRLCEVCFEIDFQNVAPAAQFCSKPRSQEQVKSPLDKDLGTIEEILEREDRCNFCALIAKHIKQLSLDSVGQCKLLCELDFCLSCDQAEFTRDGPHTHTKTAWVQFHPDNTLLWAPLPWELESHASHAQGVRQLFQLQLGYNPHDNKQLVNPLGITGRRVLPLIDLDLLKNWIKTCERKHVGKCPHGSSKIGREIGFMPMFVIDIEKRCIVNTTPNCRYVALSYVWGTGKILKHIGANSTLLRTPGSLLKTDLPATIRDAVSLVEGIGEKYLWVDALCIIQDSLAMQQTQIAKMDQIYANALFTIVAASGSNAETGLPGVCLSPRNQFQEIVHFPGGYFYTLICDGREAGHIINKSTWAQRAWTMQELLFSSRCLLFTEFQVYWKCQSAAWLEEVALEDTTSTDFEIINKAGTTRFPDRPLDQYDYSRLYQNLVTNYLQRHLSFQSDVINAFSGICGRLSAIQNDHFFWGMPQSRFSWSLGWGLYKKQIRNYAHTRLIAASGTVQEVPFPSWSWAAWTSGDITPWIRFLQSRGGGLTSLHRECYEFQPVIDFWISDEAGTVTPIREPGRHASSRLDGHETQQRFPWQGVEYQLPEALARTDATLPPRRPGLLYFWTSVAKVTLGFGVGAETFESLVISRTDDDSENQILGIFTVEWRDGIAYRLECMHYDEARWLTLKERQWRFVTLG